MTEYLVPYANAESEFEEKRSRFISHVFLVESEAEARARIDEMKKKYYDARHNCWCFVLHDGTVRYGDDGEPQGTAGQPMLNVFQRENVENVVCIVTRYFGGILLGAGGLTRAYAKAAKDALDNAGKARMQPFSVLLLECPYPMFERIKLLIEGHEGRIEFERLRRGGDAYVSSARAEGGGLFRRAHGALRRAAERGRSRAALSARRKGVTA